MENKERINLLLAFLILLIIPVISSLEVECTTTEKCLEIKGTGFFCDTKTFTCVEGAGVEIVDENGSNPSMEISEDNPQNNNSIAQSLIIALGIIVGLIVLGLLIRKRKRN